jgi:hypothetical protein
MKGTKLIDVFFSFSNKELKEFDQFVRSPYFNRREEVIRLFNYLVENKDFSADSLTKERAWKYVFSNLDYDDGQMRYTMSFLLKTMKDFLIQQQLFKDKTYTQVLLCRALRQRGINNIFQKEITTAIEQQEKHPYRNANFHYNNYLLNIEKVEAYPSQKERNKDPLLQKSIDELTHFYISDILRQSCSVLSAQAMMQKDYTLNFLKEVLDHVEQTDYSDKPAIEIYYNGYRALKDLNDEKYFKQLKILIEKHWQEFPIGEGRAIYLLAINCCIKRANRGYAKYKWECFELYKSGFQNKVLLENGVLSKFTFTNVSRLGLALKEFDWVESFLKSYKSYLPVSERENTYNYILALFYFLKPDYTNAMKLLQKVNFNDVLDNLDSRRMLLRIYYELREYSALDSLLDTFNVYLSRHKDIGYHKDNYANLIYFVKKILKANLSDKAQKLKLIGEIEATQAIAEKAWLLEQLD